MKKTVILIALAMMAGVHCFAQMSAFDNSAKEEKSSLISLSKGVLNADHSNEHTNLSSYGSFTRGDGFVIRPELYRGIFANFGYQINPYVQVYLGLGYSDGLDGALGLRAYTGDANWVAMFDLRFSVTDFALPGVALVAGASYKDLDFGAGLKYYTDGYYYLYVPVLTVGWNIRCYNHR